MRKQARAPFKTSFKTLVKTLSGLALAAGVISTGLALKAVPGLAAPAGWSRQQAAGYALDVPTGWKPQFDAQSGRIDVIGPIDQWVTLWPLYLPSAPTQAQAKSIAATLSQRAWVNASWQQPEVIGPAAVRVRGSIGGKRTLALLTWRSSAKGTVGFLSMVAAPPERFDMNLFSRILTSLHLSGPPKASPPARVSEPKYRRYQDPAEGAFSLDLPASWKNSGKLTRKASVDVRAAVESRSGDGKIITYIGDPNLGSFIPPSPMLANAGIFEGGTYSPGYNVVLKVAQYLPGASFAQAYPRGCEGARLVDSNDRPDIAAKINQAYANAGLASMAAFAIGDASFECSGGRRAYVLAGTLFINEANSGFTMWQVPLLYGYSAASGSVPLAEAVLKHMTASYQINPAWARRQGKTAVETARIASQTNQQIMSAITSSYWARQHSSDERSRQWSNRTLDLVDVEDPSTGRTTKVSSGSNYYWISNDGTITGTDTDASPGPGLR
ncbi:MAG TPA: hypothetical protein V6D23_27495, partial [Candidatus Obscuribacterales bacterium]